MNLKPSFGVAPSSLAAVEIPTSSNTSSSIQLDNGNFDTSDFLKFDQDQNVNWSLIPLGSYKFNNGVKGGVNPRMGISLRTSNYSSYNWVQTIYTNRPRLGAKSPYIDARPKTFPFYFSPAEASNYRNYGYDMMFDDRPTRYLDEPGYTYWRAELSLIGMTAGSYQRIITFTYGFSINNGVLKTYTPIEIRPSSTHLNHLSIVK